MKTKEYSMREMIIDQCLGTGREFTREDVTLTRAHWRNRKGNFSHGVNFFKKSLAKSKILCYLCRQFAITSDLLNSGGYSCREIIAPTIL